MHSCRTFAAATTNSAPTPETVISESRQHSTNSDERSEPVHRIPRRTPRHPIEQCNSAARAHRRVPSVAVRSCDMISLALTSGGCMVDTPKSGPASPAARPSPDSGLPSSVDNEVDRLVSEAGQMSRRRPLLVGFGFGVVITVAAAVFIVQNTRSVQMEWLWFDFSGRVWLSLSIAFFAGAVASPLIGLGIVHLQRSREKRLDLVDRVERRRRIRSKPKLPLPPTSTAGEKQP
jgi:uncharacterized integral membrane protein